MGIPHAKPGQVIKLILSEEDLKEVKTTALIKTQEFETIRLCLKTGQELPAHHAKSSITVQCLQGKINFKVGEKDNELQPGDWLYLEGGQEHSLKAVEDSTLLLTLILAPQNQIKN